MKSCGSAVLLFILLGSTAFSQDVLEWGTYRGYRVRVNKVSQRNSFPHESGDLVARSGYDWVNLELEFEADAPPPEAGAWLEGYQKKYRGLLHFKDVLLVERGNYEPVEPDDGGKLGASTSVRVTFEKTRAKGKAELWFVVPDAFQIRAATFTLHGQSLYLEVEASEVLRRLDDHAWD